jgi:hypothetical protein
MSKLRRFTILTAIATSVILFPADQFAHATSSDTRKATVDRFLTAWLVRKNSSTALRFFHPSALNSFPVIDDTPHDDYIADAEKKNPTAVRGAVRRFLKRYAAHLRGHTLHTILFLNSRESPEQSAYLSRFTKLSFNQPARDQYWLMTFEAAKSISKAADWSDYEKRYDLRDAFVSVMQYRVLNENPRYGDDIIVMCLWVKSGAQWKIAFVAVPDNSASRATPNPDASGLHASGLGEAAKSQEQKNSRLVWNASSPSRVLATNLLYLEDLHGISKTSITWNPTDRCVVQRDHHWPNFRVEMGCNICPLLGQRARRYAGSGPRFRRERSRIWNVGKGVAVGESF